MSSKFESNIVSVYGDKGKRWLIDLPNIVTNIADEWNLSDIKPVDNLSMNFVASGIQNNQGIILKLSLNEDLIEREYIALQAFCGFGAVKVLARKENALLLKKLDPGVSLKTYLPERRLEALEIACNVTRRLHQAPLPVEIKLPTIEERFSILEKNWPIPSDYLTLAHKFRNEIFSKYQTRKILHGDLHHDNILQDGHGWKVIDPHAVIGFPINEVWALVKDVNEDIPFITNYFRFNIDDLKKCYFIHNILAAIWSIEDNMDPSLWLEQVMKIKF